MPRSTPSPTSPAPSACDRPSLRNAKYTGSAIRVTSAPKAVRYFGVVLDDETPAPGVGARLGKIDFETWFSRTHDNN